MRTKLEEKIDVLKEFPMRVSFPYAGSYLLLIWYTEWEANHVLAVRDEASLFRTWPIVLKKNGGSAKPTALWRADIVCPPPKIRLAGSLASLKENFDSFGNYVGGLIAECQHRKMGLPEGFIKCKKYLSKYGDEDSPPRDDENHWTCRNCFHGYRVKGVSVEDFYLAERHQMKPEKLEGGVSVAPEADPKLPLFVIKESFGHHREGAYVSKVEDDDSFDRHFHSPKFFFQGGELDIPKQVIDERAKWDRRSKDDEVSRKKKFEEERDARAKAAYKDLEVLVGLKSGKYP